ncbi:hypothetical protein [Paenibacillus sp. 1P07SE]|uniref:hypothetical protein n=1 Tax=Paenibacillus sp. 1P07SE TaxID=3132209 RepID=UPI0039A75FCD
MHWFGDYKEELAYIFDDARLRVSRFPDPLGQLGHTYMDAFNPLLEGSTKNYVCYLLPYWLEDALPLRREHARELALANVFGMLHYFILDDVMDAASSPSGWTEQLALSELFMLQYLSLYRKLFPHDSSFWQYHDNYIAEWSSTVCNERDENYFLTDPLRIAKKAGPVKLASTGALLLCDRAQLLYPVSEMVDLLLVTLQMNDDWADWEEDLASGSYNGLVALIKSMEGLTSQHTITSEQVRRALYMSGAMSRYSARAIAAHQRLKTLDFIAPKLLDFHLFLVDQLAQASVRFEEERRSLELGALNHWIYKNLN